MKKLITKTVQYKIIGFDSYSEYLSSDHWRQLKENYWMSNLPRFCRLCEKPYDLQLHHRTYETLGNENIKKDVVLLCSTCHHELHHNGKDKTPLIKEELIKRENYLYKRNRSWWYKFLNAKPSEMIAYIQNVYSLKPTRKDYLHRKKHRSTS